jgi:hypothetical protein
MPELDKETPVAASDDAARRIGFVTAVVSSIFGALYLLGMAADVATTGSANRLPVSSTSAREWVWHGTPCSSFSSWPFAGP